MKIDCDAVLESIKNSDKEYIIGVDEVGTGALSGDIYVCAFAASKSFFLEGLNDSKKLTDKKRQDICNKLYGNIHFDRDNNIFYDGEDDNFYFSITSIHPNDKETCKEYGSNLHAALKYLYWKAVYETIYLSKLKSFLIVLDGNIAFPEYPSKLGDAVSLPKADGLISHVMAASIIAKVNRDVYMKELDLKYPVYDWKNNKGYGSPKHFAALEKHGYCKEHRLDYEPIKSMVKQ